MTESPAPRLPTMSPWILLRNLFRRPGNGAASIQTVYTLEGIDRGSVRPYNELLGFAPDAMPLTWFYLIAQRAHLATMLTRGFPFRIPGMIHVANELVAHRAIDPHSPLTITTELDIERPDDRGAVYCVLRTSGRQGDGEVFTCASRYLAVRGRPATGARAPREMNATLPPLASWLLAPSTGRRYARVSGDWNPIHLWGWSARLMGMKAPIIHGMHTLGKACAALEAATGRHVVSMSARFQAPVPLGSKATLAADPAAGSFVVTCNGGDAVRGTFSLA
jgi:acyl dehydratase